MTRDRGSALEGFNVLYDGAGYGSMVVAEKVQTKCVLDYELVRQCQLHGDKPHKGDPLGKLPELWPFDMLKRPLLEHARLFVSQIASQGFVPMTDVYAFKVWGPFTEKVGEVRTWTPEEGNHTIPKHEQRQAVRAWGYQGDEFDFEKGCAFIVQGEFTRNTKHGHIDEQTGRVYV